MLRIVRIPLVCGPTGLVLYETRTIVYVRHIFVYIYVYVQRPYSPYIQQTSYRQIWRVWAKKVSYFYHPYYCHNYYLVNIEIVMYALILTILYFQYVKS